MVIPSKCRDFLGICSKQLTQGDFEMEAFILSFFVGIILACVIAPWFLDEEGKK